MRFAILVTIFLIGCAPAPAHPGHPNATAEADVEAIRIVLDELLLTAASADEKAYFSKFTSDARIYGPDADQSWDREAFRAFTKKHYEKIGWRAVVVERTVSIEPSGGTAWFDEELQTDNQGPMRGVGLARKGQDGRWRIARYHFAMLIPEADIQAVKRLLSH